MWGEKNNPVVYCYAGGIPEQYKGSLGGMSHRKSNRYSVNGAIEWIISYCTNVACAFIIAICFATAGHAQSTGIPLCDDYLEKEEICMTSKLPAVARDVFDRASIDQQRQRWIDAAKNPALKDYIEYNCKMLMETKKAMFSKYGCF
jgi:hypothetical protein